ncbi:GAP family protein [Corynebacterium sp. CCUG 69979]|uniref:GAP family protein n=1 Tax=unclassified Corynebacterium TaxID=2624378 RepID=UPI002109AE47|nr:MULTISPECIES: GAP family protein [unclassified Corynebacterium]MCQ4623347.1 GAP family protein [Corynebacterium sp. CCUG 70398]MCQ4624930.1 GAP family protein [Corynebacterium sp. CCUG 69979]
MHSLIPLVGLALLDSLSSGTLVIPLALIVMWRSVRVPALAAYLLTVAAVYFALGVAMLLGFTGLSAYVERITDSPVFPWITLILGAILAIYGTFGPDPVKPAPGELPKRLNKPIRTSLPKMIILGLGASLTEAATMLPYIAAMGIISDWDTPMAGQLLAIAAYCGVMIAPTVILAMIALVAGQKFFPRLEKAIPRLQYETKVTLLWIAAIVGIYMVIHSVGAIR